jgi:RHS repeat-associated protein
MVSGVKTWQPASNFGWLAQTVVMTGYISYTTTVNVCDWPLPKHGTFNYYGNFVYHDSFGVSHSFGSQYLEYDSTGCDSTINNFSATATDGSGLVLNAVRNASGGPKNVQSITSPNGQVILAPVGNGAVGSTITDSNGNQVSISSAGVFMDTLGVNVMSVGGVAPSPVTLTYPTATGTASFTVKYGTYTVQTKFLCSTVSDYGPIANSLINEIDLPDGSKYLFNYEPTPGVAGAVTGRLANLTLPQGGVITYGYSGGNAGIVCADGGTATLTRTLNSDSANVTTYTRTPGSSTSHTDVTDGLGNLSNYDFVTPSNASLANYYPTAVSKHQLGSGGPVLLAQAICYNGHASPCVTSPFTVPVTQIDTFNTLDAIQQNGSTAKYNTYGLQTERDDYDFGTSTARGPLMRKEQWTYPTTGNVSLLSSDVITDGSGATAGKTTYLYDIGGLAGTVSLPQHVPATGQRGNATTITQYYSASGPIVTSPSYEDTGNVISTITPNGTTSLSYDATHAYVSTVTPPTPSSGVPLPTSATYEPNSGVLKSTTDPNLAPTTYQTTTDPFLRPNEVDFPDGGKTGITYPSPTQTSMLQYQSGSVNGDLETLYDGYGRISRVAQANGQSANPWYQQDNCYDGNGNIQFTSYQYQATGFVAPKVCSGNGDTFAHDALGRLTLTTHADGTNIHYTYTGRATQVTDENGVSRISQVDGIGRPVSVCEISANNLMPGSGPTAPCGLDLPGAGFLTVYGNDLAGHKTTVTQGAQTRVFQTDWLGRTTFVQTPESGGLAGATTYSYAYNATGLVVTRKRPKANQTVATVQTTTISQYDAVGRILSVTYDDGTPAKSFGYDASSGWGLSQTNLKGRMAAGIGSGTGVLFSYDSMGRVVANGQCFPSGCGNGSLDRYVTYTYDWLGNIKTMLNGASSVTTTYTYSIANEIGSITSSQNDTTHPPSLISNVQNGPYGPSSYQLGNGLAYSLKYDALGRRVGQWVCNGSILNNCTGGTQVYGYTLAWQGVRNTSACDTALNRCENFGYDEFNRLASQTVTSGTVKNFTYTYDRWGNRWAQNALQGGPAPSFLFDTTTNRINTAGYAYDAAGNLTNDTFHTYQYDAEGNVLTVDTGAIATYVYDALNRRTFAKMGPTGTSPLDYIFNMSGQRIATLNGTTEGLVTGVNYWGNSPINLYQPSAVHFQHQDWTGTERTRTTYNGAVEGTFQSYVFGDGFTFTGADNDPYHFAALDKDYYSNTDHAQFRQYSNTEGRWMSPDPYAGSYDFSDPQSLNRYTYARNNPVVFLDPLGLENTISVTVWFCGFSCSTGGGGGGGGASSGSPNGGPGPGTWPCYEYGGNYCLPPGGVSGNQPNPNPAPNKGQTWSQFGQAAKSCAASSFGLSTAAAGGAVASGLNVVSSAGKFSGMTAGTSIASQFFRGLLPQAIGSTWAPTISNPLATSGVLGGVVGRWVPVIGEAVMVYQGAKFVSCLYESDDTPWVIGGGQ